MLKVRGKLQAITADSMNDLLMSDGPRGKMLTMCNVQTNSYATRHNGNVRDLCRIVGPRVARTIFVFEQPDLCLQRMTRLKGSVCMRTPSAKFVRLLYFCCTTCRLSWAGIIVKIVRVFNCNLLLPSQCSVSLKHD